MDLPEWIAQLGAAVWVSGPDRKIWYLNRKAEALLSLAASEVVGRPCHQVMEGLDAAGAPFCSARCAWFCAAEQECALEPQLMQVRRGEEDRRWVQVIGIPVTQGDVGGKWLVHCAMDMDWSKRMEGYLKRVATRSGENGDGGTRRRLTAREHEVLTLLSRDMELPEVAADLHVSRVTVRNHVQHILGKLNVHSIQEAVALHVLGMVEPPKFRGPGGSTQS